jgi:hypothetical protein
MGFFDRIRGRKGGGSQRADLERLVTIGTNLQAGVGLDAIAERIRTLHGRRITAEDIFRTIEQVFQQALEIARAIGDRKTEAETLYNLARLYQDPPRKTVLATQGLSWDEMESLVTGAQGGSSAPPQHDVALNLYHDALTLAGRENMTTLQTCCLLNIAVSHRHLGDMAQHRDYWSRAERGASSIQDAATRRQVEQAIQQERGLAR